MGGFWQDSDDNESIRALRRAVECDINFFDTALAYGQGHSEQLLGEFLQHQKTASTLPQRSHR